MSNIGVINVVNTYNQTIGEGGQGYFGFGPMMGYGMIGISGMGGFGINPGMMMGTGRMYPW